MTRRRVVVTGMGLVAPGARDLSTFWARLTGGVSAVGPIRRFDASAYPSRIGAESGPLTDEEAALIPPELVGRGPIAEYAGLAAARAADAARLSGVRDRTRLGVVLGSGLGTYGHLAVFGPLLERRGEADGEAYIRAQLAALEPDALARRTPGSLPAAIARHQGIEGPAMSVMTACAGGTQAIGDALRWIRLGRCDAVLAGASDSELYPMGLASFCLLGALSRRNDEPERASRPFDRDRDGFVIGEGAGVLVLEEREHARARGATIWAEVTGFGSACDAWRVTDPHPDGTGAILAMRRALADAGLSPGDIGYVNAHGTSTPANDRIESVALRTVFGARASTVPVSSTKSMIGHLTVAAGAVEAIATVLTLVHETIHPTINHETPDPDCDLDVVPGVARRAAVAHALSSSFAFGGQTAALVVSRAG